LKINVKDLNLESKYYKMNQEQLEQAQEYIKNNVAGILEKLTVDLLEEKPKKTVDYMINWLDKNGDDAHKDAIRKIINRPLGIDTSESEDEEDGDEEEQDKFEKLIEMKRSTIKDQRKSISAEVYGQYKKEIFNQKSLKKMTKLNKKFVTYYRIVFCFVT